MVLSSFFPKASQFTSGLVGGLLRNARLAFWRMMQVNEFGAVTTWPIHPGPWQSEGSNLSVLPLGRGSPHHLWAWISSKAFSVQKQRSHEEEKRRPGVQEYAHEPLRLNKEHVSEKLFSAKNPILIHDTSATDWLHVMTPKRVHGLQDFLKAKIGPPLIATSASNTLELHRNPR